MVKSKRKKDIYSKAMSAKRLIDRKQKSLIGIDIGSSSIKLVEMKKNQVLAKWALEIAPIGIVNQGRIEAIEPLAEIISNMLNKYKIKSKECALYISGGELIVRELRMPEMDEDQINENIIQEILSVLPMDHEEYCIDYKILEYIKNEGEDIGQLRVLVGAIPKNLVSDYIAVLKKAGLKTRYVDVLPNIVGKIYRWAGDKIGKSNVCFVDFGAKKTEIIILKDGNYVLHKLINYGGEYLNSLISMKSEMDVMEVDEYKSRTNFFVEVENNPLNKQVIDYFEFLIRDFERTMEFYTNKTHEKVEKIYLMGGGAMLEGLPQYMQRLLSIDVHLISDVFTEYQNIGAVGRYISVFPHAIGVTLREEWKYEK